MGKMYVPNFLLPKFVCYEFLIDSAIGDRERPVPLLTCIIKSLKWPIISAIIPRICQLGLMMSQPFLINRTINFISEPVNQHSKNVGYGLIGAYGLVYIGTAVRDIPQPLEDKT